MVTKDTAIQMLNDAGIHETYHDAFIKQWAEEKIICGVDDFKKIKNNQGMKSDKTLKEIGKSLREYRTSKKYQTLREFCLKYGLDATTISRLEQGCLKIYKDNEGNKNG